MKRNLKVMLLSASHEGTGDIQDSSMHYEHRHWMGISGQGQTAASLPQRKLTSFPTEWEDEWTSKPNETFGKIKHPDLAVNRTRIPGRSIP
jgi:hypothetical protein